MVDENTQHVDTNDQYSECGQKAAKHFSSDPISAMLMQIES